MQEQYDSFPSNVGEIAGIIPRQSFIFNYGKIEVWQNGVCIYSDNSHGVITAKVVNTILNVSLNDDKLNRFIKKTFTFEEISTIHDRIMWSNDFGNNKGGTLVKFVPDDQSLFYKNGVLSKIAYTIYDPYVYVEFYNKEQEILQADPFLDLFVSTMSKRIYSCGTRQELKELIDSKHLRLGVFHPQIDYAILDVLINFKDFEKAMTFVAKGVNYGFKYPNPFFNTYYSDSIGQIYSKALLFLNPKIDLNPELFNWFCIGYIYLSQAIKLLGIKAVDSYRTRAILFTKYREYVIENVFPKYLSEIKIDNEILWQLVISDNIHSSEGYKQYDLDNDESLIRKGKAESAFHDEITSYTFNECIANGKKMHDLMFERMFSDYIEAKLELHPLSFLSIFP